MNTKSLGIILVALSFCVIGLLLYIQYQTYLQTQEACEESCATTDGTTCDIDTCPLHSKNNLAWVIWAASILVALVGGVGLYLSFSKKEAVIEQKEYDISKLDDLEKKVFETIRAVPEGMYQNALRETFQLSKVQMTRLIDKLEQANLVERKRRGFSNVIKVK